MTDRKILKKLEKCIKKLKPNVYSILDKIAIKQYLELTSGIGYGLYDKDKNIGYLLLSDVAHKKAMRDAITSTLININYVKTTKKWNKEEVCTFMNIVFKTYLDEENTSKKAIDEANVIIKRMFGIEANRIKSTMTIFIKQIEDGDSLGMYNLFSVYEILSWKYRNPDKLKEDMENNKIKEEDLELIRKLFDV